MSEHDHDSRSGTAEDETGPSPEVVALETVDGETLLYDRNQHTAWISATKTVPLVHAR